MPEVIIDGTGVAYPLKIDSNNNAYVNVRDMSGYPNNQIIRLTVGSPATNFVFSSVTQSFSIENLGSEPAYYKFDGVANLGSTSGYLPPYSFRSFDSQIGSVSVLGSGTATPAIQCVRLS
jgi:hypothetical protein